MAPLVFLALIFACAASRIGAVWPWAVSTAAILAAVSFCGPRPQANSWISISVFGYSIVVLVGTLIANRIYTSAGLFHPLMLMLGLYSAHRIGQGDMKPVAIAMLLFGAILSGWGLVQISFLGMARAYAFLETPATFSAVLNLLLVPVLAIVLLGIRAAPLLAIGVVLAAGIFAADSRGGQLALVAGLGVATICSMRAHLFRPPQIGLVLVVLVAGWLIATGLRALPKAQSEAMPTASARAESSLSRLELYALSWEAWRELPLTGTGYLTFRYTLDQGRAKVPSYGESTETWFVHNDYLQTLQELGPLGLLALLGITALPPLLAYRRLPSLAKEDRPAVVASAAGLGAMSVHALVDFPFYIPVCLLLYGALLGALDRRLSRPASARTWQTKPWYRPVRTGVIAVVAVVLMRPVLAEAAAEWGLRKSAAGEGQSAAFWLGAAQRIDPRDWRYHWYAGQFWDAQASDSGMREAARLAAAAYAAGLAANPLEVRNLLGMISVHRRHRNLLDEPADAETLQRWQAQASVLAPLNPAVRRELAQ